MKYIDAEKLLAEIERRMEDCKLPDGRFPTTTNIVRYEELSCLRNFITSLQQEQPDVDLDKEIEEQFDRVSDGAEHVPVANLLRPTFARIARHFYELGLNARKKELPEIGLDKFTDKVNTFKARYKHPESISIKGAMAFMARMFYQYPNVARQWYDSLPKTTMD